MSGPSDKAVEAARNAHGFAYANHQPRAWYAALEAAHSPALGLDRSVCLRDVIEAALRWEEMNPASRVREGVAPYLSQHLEATFAKGGE